MSRRCARSSQLHLRRISNKDDQKELTEFGVDYVSGDAPVIGARDAAGLKYKMTEDFSVDNFKAFLTTPPTDAGTLEPWIKSEPCPTMRELPLKVAVAKNFEELVTKSTKDGAC